MMISLKAREVAIWTWIQMIEEMNLNLGGSNLEIQGQIRIRASRRLILLTLMIDFYI